MAPPLRSTTPASELAGTVLRDPETGKQSEETQLLRLLSLLNAQHDSPRRHERPDFLFNLRLSDGVTSVGCELTNLYTVGPDDLTGFGSAEARFWSQWRSFAKRLKDALQQSCDDSLGNVYGAVHFRRGDFSTLDRLVENDLLSEIVQILETSDALERFDVFPEQRFPQLHNHVDHIWTADVSDEPPPLWWATHLRSGRLHDPGEALAEALTEKITSSKSYNWQDSQLRWLVVTAAGCGLRDKIAYYTRETFSPPTLPVPFSHVILFAFGIEGWFALQLHPDVSALTTIDDLSHVS